MFGNIRIVLVYLFHTSDYQVLFQAQDLLAYLSSESMD